MKSAVVQMRVTEEEKRAWMEAAEFSNMTLSEWMRGWLNCSAENDALFWSFNESRSRPQNAGPLAVSEWVLPVKQKSGMAVLKGTALATVVTFEDRGEKE